ncbi:hypothetical protein BDQ12DRAFT_681359 [Crucibulum laeve]|uniref:Uncharacterized protein n=1 Tax=Crucibulum laeve TaxID=68775 RepID=A0A5C3M4R1_9AGAR|nr:hypothetical protein BDQ12DRAFT_681359 [Crucibulum laeve]
MSTDSPHAHRRSVSTPAGIRRSTSQPRSTRYTSPDTYSKAHMSSHSGMAVSSSSLDLSADHVPPRPTRTVSASRIMTSVRRSLTPSSSSKKRQQDISIQKSGMHSTPEERYPYHNARFRDPLSSSSTRPTIEQIAMGLHVSRTPHLRPLGSGHQAYSQRNSPAHSSPSLYGPHHRAASTPITLPPPPARSSLKKPSTGSSSSSPALSPHFSAASASSTTVTSLTLSSGSLHPLTNLKSRMARLLPGSKAGSAPGSMLGTPVSSPRGSSDIPAPKKAVRFRTDDDSG